MKHFFTFITLLLCLTITSNLKAQENNEEEELYSEEQDQDVILVNGNLELRELTYGCYLYTDWYTTENQERKGYNGMLIITGSYATLINTPSSKEQTIALSRWCKKEHQVKLGFCLITNHDAACVAGIDWLNKHKVDVMASAATNLILEKNGLVKAAGKFTNTFTVKGDNKTDVQIFKVPNNKLLDQCLVWLPAQKILYGGELIEAHSAKQVSGTIDRSAYGEWHSNLEKLKKLYYDAAILVPLHGEVGDASLIDYTLQFTAAAGK